MNLRVRMMASSFGKAVLALLCAGSVLAHPGGVDSSGCHIDEKSGRQHCHQDRASSKKQVYDNQHPPQPGDEGVFFGPFVSLSDGDTFRAKVQGVVMEFRLSDIDAPEYDQPYGSRAREELRSLIAGQQLVIVFMDIDRYGRTVAQVWIDKLDVNREMVARGAAWFYARYARNEALFEVEEKARDAQRGLWALPAKERMEPWTWREMKRQSRTTASPVADKKKAEGKR